MSKRMISTVVFLLALAVQVSAEDKVTIEDFVISPGETKELSITLENEVTYAAFQFNLYLPEGLSISEYCKDEARVPEGTTLSMSQVKDGSYKFIAVAMKTNNIVGTSGSIATIKVTASKDVVGGSLTAYFRKVKLSKLDGTGSTYEEMAFPITVLKPGDANYDNEVDTKDIVAITEYMMGKEPENFNVKNADVNGDGIINIADIIQIVKQILKY